MTEEKMILNDGQYDLDMRTRKVRVSADVLADKGWHKLDSNEQVVKIVELTKEEADFVENHMSLPFCDSKEPLSYIISLNDYVYEKNVEHPRQLLAKLALAYFNGYTIKKEKKYYIELNFNYHNGSYLKVNRFGVWAWGEKCGIFDDMKTQFTQDEIDEMQKDPRAKGLDLNILKVEVPEDELED